MINKTDWPKLRENSVLHRKAFMDYVSRLRICVESYKNREIDADTALRICREILSEIDDPEFPFFAVRNYRGLFSFILYQLPNCLSRQPV